MIEEKRLNAYLKLIHELLQSSKGQEPGILEVHKNRQDFPTEWAMTQNTLASAYIKRIQGDKAENLEMAITILPKKHLFKNGLLFKIIWQLLTVTESEGIK